MNHLSPTDNEATNKSTLPLLDRMDDAVGEASSVMGAVLTELLRRTLRGGVSQIGEGLTGYVSDQVDAAIADRTPAIEQSAAEVADRTARTAATEIVVEEVRALESRARETDEKLASRIEETHKHFEQTTTASAEELTSRIREAERSAEQLARDTARDLAAQIAEAEKRATETAQAEMARQLQDMRDRSLKGLKVLVARLDTQEGTTTGLAKQLSDEQNARRAELSALKADTQERTRTALEKLRQEMQRAMEEQVTRLRADLAELTEANEALTARVTELEKPRGLRWLIQKLMFWRKPKPAVAE